MDGVERDLEPAVLHQKEEKSEKHGKSVEVYITNIIPVLQHILDIFTDIISIQHVLHFDDG